MITKENFKDLLILLDFKENPAQIFSKTLTNNTALKVDFKAKKLIYPANTSANLSEPNGIIIHDDTTSNFSHPENFVVFECVHRLLQKGYKKEHIELEPRWNLGREAKGGKADILVRDNEQKPYLLIECKTTDSKNSEFMKEWRRMQADGGQLFSYFQQERDVKFLCLYTSDLTKSNSPQNQNTQDFSLNYSNFIIATQDNKSYLQDLSTQYKTIITGYAHATSSAEAFEVWREVYKLEYAEIGIFERNINAYEAGQNALCFADLQELSSYNDEGKTYEDGKYHEFAKILRKYNISGKENAFDKLVNLFLCKIYDENHNKEILNFCYRGNASDSIEAMQDRLMLLYKEAMKEFLGEEITYISDEQINKQFSDFKHHKIDTQHLKEQMQEFIRQLKFYSHSDFSFLEVHNKELFLQNGEVLKAVVKLFEKLKLTQNKTNQLLGNLFELFLQKGMKQDEGQFFTPMPICEFIIHSLPLETMLEKGTPKVIDYACGAGHFLNTYANILTHAILPNDEQKQERLDELFSHIYGIEKEYRLSKVAKVAAAMFSQEKINITYADALDFAKFTHKDFDLLISNPPYSVKGFAQTLNKSAYAKFELKDKVSDLDSFNAIECFFIERANSLLASNAKLAIVLPSSILNKGGIYESTREIILRNFDIIAIVELGSATFGATGTNTIILFANKRETYASSQDSQSYLNLKDNIEESLSFDNVYLNAFLREYCEFMGYNQADFGEFLNGKINTTLAKTPEFSEYEKAFLSSSGYANLLKAKAYKDAQNQVGKDALKQAAFLKFALEIEKDKLLHFALNHKTEVLIVKSPSDLKEQKKFLGYEWSNRKGDEGLKELHNPYQSQLFERENPHNETKINVLIKNAFLNNTNQIPQELEKHAFKARLVEMLDFSRAEFNKAITLNPATSSSKTNHANPFENSKFELVKLGEALKSQGKGKRPASFANPSGIYPFIKSSKIIEKCNEADFDTEALIIGDGGGANIHYLNGKFSSSDHTYIFTSNKEDIYLKFFYEVINANLEILEVGFKGIALKNISKTFIENIQIPKPPLEIQKQIVSECEKVEKQNSALNKAKQCLKELIKAILAQTGISEDETQEPTSLLNTLLEFQNTFKALSLNFKFDLNALQKDLNALPHPPQQGWERAKLGDKSIFELKIGKRVLDSELHAQGKIPVYSANVLKPFGFINKELLENYDKESVLWGIDGDWIVGFMPKNTPFYPTDHCGVLSVKEDKGKAKIVQFALENEGAKFGFSRTLRASIERVEGLKIPLPPLKEQEKISSCIEKLETQISHLNSMLLNLETQKTNIIKGYLF